MAAAAALTKAYDETAKVVAAHPVPAAALAVVAAIGGIYGVRRAFASKRDHCMSATEVTLGNIKDGHKEVGAYFKFFKQSNGAGVKDKSQTPQFVDTFYNMVTDIYEWGWGHSFHFSPQLPGKTFHTSQAVHEGFMARSLGLKPGMKCLDVGCGIGGPMRTIAAASGAHVTGITINAYQVSRCKCHNKKMGLENYCDVVQGNFLEMPFAVGQFDAVYAIEATCHAPSLEKVYSECFRVLKPGGVFATFEWVSTPKFDAKNKEHVDIIDDINYTNALPDMRTWLQAEAAAKAAGFEIVESRDLAHACAANKGWWTNLQRGASEWARNDMIIRVLAAIGVAPKAIRDVHKMLMNTSISLVQSGEKGIFSPMQFILMRKPAAARK